MPGMGTPSSRATARLRMSATSAARSAMYSPAPRSSSRNSSKAADTAWAAGRPASRWADTLVASTGSRAMRDWACSTAGASPAAWAGRPSSAAATASRAAVAAWASPGPAGPGGGSSGGGASHATGPVAIPGLTPIPRNSTVMPASAVVGFVMGLTALLGVQVAGHQVDQRVEGGVGPVALGGEHDHLAAAGVQRQHRQDGAGVDRFGTGLAHLHGHGLGGGGLHEQAGGAGVQAHAGSDGDGTFRHLSASFPGGAGGQCAVVALVGVGTGRDG